MQGDEAVDADQEEETILITRRVLRRDKHRQDAREGQKRQGDQFLQNTQNKQILDNFNVGDNVVSFYMKFLKDPMTLRTISLVGVYS